MTKLLTGLNEVQQQAVAYGDGPMLILAGAGSGKTRVLTHRIAWLIEQGIDPGAILAITFTNKAAGEMKKRVRSLLNTPDDHLLPDMGTFHAMCVRILRRHGKHVGIPNNFTIYDETDSNALIKQAMEKLNIPQKKVNPSAVKSTISSAKNEMVSANEYAQYARGFFQDIVAKVFPIYQNLLLENQALDFDDLLLVTHDLIKSNEDIQNYYHNKWQYVLVDEYQDTNRVQYLLTKLLAGSQGNINAVGDAAQSIYAFRGADLRNVSQFLEDYPTAQVYNLEQNYRSTQKILDVATAMIVPNQKAHPVLKLWTDNPAGDDVTLYEAESGEGEAKYIIQEISKLTTPITKRRSNEKVRNYADFAILYRTNAQSRIIEEALIHAGIPYQIIGGVRFYDRREVKDMLAYLRLVLNPKDTVSFERIVNTPPRGIGQVTLKQGGPALERFQQMVDDFRALAVNLNVVELLDAIIEKIGYENYILDGTEEGTARWENIQELRLVASSFSDLGPGESLMAFIESVSLLEQSDVVKDENEKVVVLGSGDECANKVTLMTLHAAKGLEFPVVFLVGLEEGLLPHSRSLDQKFDLEEERRLAYVGITRAMEKLCITYARSRTVFGSFAANVPSRFLKDLPMEIVDFTQAPPLFDQYAGYSGYHKRSDDFEPDPLNPWEL